MAQSLENQLVDLWDLQSGDQKYQMKMRSTGDAKDVAISNDGTLLAVALESGALEIYNLKTRQLLKVLELYTCPINQVLSQITESTSLPYPLMARSASLNYIDKWRNYERSGRKDHQAL